MSADEDIPHNIPAQSDKNHEKLLHAVNQAAVLLLTTGDNENIEDTVSACLEYVGRAVNADRLHIWKYEQDKSAKNFACRCRWLSETGKQKIVMPSEINFPFMDNRGWEQGFIKGECINTAVLKMNQEEKNFYGSFEIKSLVIIPVLLKKKFYGLLCIEDCIKERNFSEDEMEILRSFCLMLSGALNRFSLIAERTHEQALQTAIFTTLFNTIPDLIFVKDLNLHYVQCNRAFLEHFGKTSQDIIGNSDVQAIGVSAETAQTFNDMDRRVINKNKTIVMEDPVRHINGKTIIFETTKTPLLLDGKIIGVMGIAHDITKRKESEHEIAANYVYANRLSDALAVITKSHAVYCGDIKTAALVIAQRGCVALNTHRIGIWKYVQEKNILKNISSYDAKAGEHLVQEDLNMENIPQYLSLLESERLVVMNDAGEYKQISHYESDEGSINASLIAPIHVNGALAGMVCAEQAKNSFFSDGREWITAEQNFVSSLADLMALAMTGFELKKARDDAEKASQTKSSFLANMSHEIRTPMNAILGVTEMLMENKKIPAEIEEELETIYNSCDLLLGIINDILDFSKIEAGKMDIITDQYKVANLINDSIQLCLMKFSTKPVIFELDADENIPAKLIGDELRIKQIMNNLLSNAFKYTDTGKITLSVSSKPAPNGITLELGVRDTGHGMTKAQLRKMYEEYSRFNKKKNNTVEGTGLGLSITQRLVKLMNGEILVESKPAEGTFFTVRIPQITVDNEVLGKETAENLNQMRANYLTQKKRNQFSREFMPYGSVLIVDDVETNLYVAVGLMKLYHLQIETAMSGAQAVNKIREGKTYDIIFMDHMMPQMDGMEAAKRLRDLGYTSSIVALTANAVAGQAEMFLENGFDEFISKPIDIRQLNMVLNKHIRDKQPPHVLEAARLQSAQLKANRRVSTDPLLLKSFIRDARKAQAVLDELCQKAQLGSEEELRKFIIAVHGIKNSLLIIGEAMLGELAFKLETAGRERDIEVIAELIPVFMKQLRSLLERIDKKQDNFTEGQNSGDEENAEDLRYKFLAVQKMCLDYDKKGALEIISNIINCSAKTGAVLDSIKKLMLHSEFEEAGKIAGAYAADLPLYESKNAKWLLDREVRGLDMAGGLKWYEGNAQSYLKVLRLFTVSVRSMLSVIEAVTQETLDSYTIKIHGIKGTCLDIFALDCGKGAAALEEAAKSRNWDYIMENNPVFLKNIRKLIDDLEKMFSCLAAENPKPKKDKPDIEILTRLLGACRDFDIDEADMAMEEIEEYQYEADDGLALWLRENMDLMNLKQIVEKLLIICYK